MVIHGHSCEKLKDTNAQKCPRIIINKIFMPIRGNSWSFVLNVFLSIRVLELDA